MRVFLVYFILIACIPMYCQDFIWATKIDAISSYQGSGIRSVKTDNEGNVFVVGEFGGTIDFNHEPANYIMTSSPPSNTFTNGFIIKLDKNKNFIWARQIISTWMDRGVSVNIDNQNNVLMTGLASGTQIDLDPSFSSEYIVNNPDGATGSYIIKLNQSGNFLQGNFYPGYYANESVIDNNNNIITSGNVASPNTASNKIFLIKNDSNGNLLWTKLIAGNNIFPHSLACDNLNNVVLKGNFMNRMVFSNTTYNTSLYSDFICKLNSSGQEIWYLKLGNTVSAGISNEDKSIKTDNLNNIYFSSNYAGDFSATFNNTAVTLPSIFGSESALFKITESGQYVWSVPIFGNERQEIYSIGMDENENIYTIMYCNGTAYVNNSNPQNQIFSGSTQTGILLKFNRLGELLSSKHIVHYPYSLDIDYQNNIIISGNFTGQNDFNPDPNYQYLMNSGGSSSAFFLKLGYCDRSTPIGDSDQHFCSNQNPTIANLSPSSSSIKWYGSLSSTTQLPATTALIDGQIYYAAKQEGSCSESTDRLAVTVHINQPPQAPVTSNQTFCENDNATISNLIASGQNLNWYSSQTGGSALAPTTALQNNTTYYVSQTVNNCESNRTAVAVTIIPNKAPILTSPQQFCIQQNATLNDIAITGQNIKWYDALTGGNLLANTTFLQNGVTYYASQTINNCESTRVPVTVNVQNTPAPTGNANQSFCTSQNATLNDIAVTGSNLIWYSSATGTTVIPSTTLLANNTTYYTTQTVNSCESPTRLAVTVTLINTLNANNYSETLCDDLNNGSETVNLSNYNTDLIATTSGNIFTYYHSQNGAENQISSDAITNYTNYNLTVGSNPIFVRIDSSNGCHQIVELHLTLVSKPVIPITDIMPICEGSSITVNAGAGFDSYLWSTSETSPSIMITTPENYSVTVTENHGTVTCTSVKNFTVVNSNAATVSEIITSDWTNNQNTISVLLTSNSSGNYVFSLDGVHYQTSNTFTNLPKGEYTVFVKDENGCGIKTEDFYLLMYPNFFTPNGDGYNDYWKIELSEKEPDMKIMIFDRYGKLMKQLGANSEGWDGTYSGKAVPANDYWFVVTRQNGKEYRGHFSLKR